MPTEEAACGPAASQVPPQQGCSQDEGAPPSNEALLAVRRRVYGPNCATNYSDPICMMRGEGCYLYDQYDQQYLDCVNNVAHVGHSNPLVAEAVCGAMRTLNTNARYLSPALNSYLTDLVATMPEPLKVAYLVTSGSEANDLALRVAAANRPGATHVAVLGGAYHGHLSSLVPLSPYKFWGPGGAGRAPWVHVLPCPDRLRGGRHCDGRAAARAAVAAARAAGGRLCAFIAEGVVSCGGQVVLPPGYLQGVYEVMRAAGALCIADEVQSGFGRVGCEWWAFQTQGVVPDMVTLGKSIGNGMPMAALVLSPAVAAGFCNGMEFFATTGGCNAATAAGAAVLRALREGGLQARAAETGAHLQALLRELQGEVPFIGEVRGVGLMVGVEVVTDRTTMQHAPVLAGWLKERARQRRVLLSTDGPYDNVIKIKPPMVFGRTEAQLLVDTLRDIILTELTPARFTQLGEAEAAHAAAVVAPRMALYAANEAAMAAHLAAADAAATSASAPRPTLHLPCSNSGSSVTDSDGGPSAMGCSPPTTSHRPSFAVETAVAGGALGPDTAAVAKRAGSCGSLDSEGTGTGSGSSVMNGFSPPADGGALVAACLVGALSAA